MKLKTKLWIVGIIIAVVALVKSFSFLYNGTVSLYNSHVSWEQQYLQQKENQVATYDANWQSFQQQYEIADVNKEAFLVVTDIIMSNRRDGQQLAWKWLQENQPIPYNEFTDFYRNLTSFTQSQYSQYLEIERQKQLIVNQHNTYIRTYPNNVYNWWLKIKPLEYRQGYVTDHTRKLFKYSKE